MTPGRVLFATALCLLAAPRGSAQIAGAPWLHAELRHDAAALESLALDPARERELVASGAGFTELLIRFHAHHRADGVHEERVDQVRRYLSDDGASSGGDVEFWVMPSFEEAVIERAYVLQPDGTRVDVDPSAIQSVPDPSPRVFSDVRRIIVPLRGVARGATAVFSYRKMFQAKQWPLPVARMFWLQWFDPIERMEISTTWAPGVAAPAWSSDDTALRCESGHGELHCAKEHVAAWPRDPDMRSYYDDTPGLVVAEQVGWEEAAQRARRIVEAKLSEPLPSGALARIVGSAGTPGERWQRIFDFVANEIRYLGLEHGSSAVVPRAPAATLESRYGDCKDKVSLVLALARAAGIDAYAALVSTERFDPSRLRTPSTSYFNHMIACRDGANGQRECVDPTVASVIAPETTLPLGGAVMLELREGTNAPSQLARSEFGSEIEIEGDIALECDGSQHARVTRELRGVAGIAYRQGLMKMSTGERRNALAEEYRQLVSQSLTPSIEIRGLSDPRTPLAISIETRTPAATPLREHPGITDADHWTIYHGIQMRSGNRHFSYLNPGARIRSKLRYRVCAKLRPEFVGAQLGLESRYGRFERSYAVEPASVVVDSTFELPSRGVPAAEIADFNRFLETSLDQADVWFRLDER